eukprot:66673-Rhodomonas_salina.3
MALPGGSQIARCMRSPVNSAIGLRVCFELPGAGIADGAISLCARYVKPKADIVHGATRQGSRVYAVGVRNNRRRAVRCQVLTERVFACIRARCAMSGADIEDARTSGDRNR